MRLTLAFLGLAAFANAAVIATPVPTVYVTTAYFHIKKAYLINT